MIYYKVEKTNKDNRYYKSSNYISRKWGAICSVIKQYENTAAVEALLVLFCAAIFI